MIIAVDRTKYIRFVCTKWCVFVSFVYLYTSPCNCYVSSAMRHTHNNRTQSADNMATIYQTECVYLFLYRKVFRLFWFIIIRWLWNDHLASVAFVFIFRLCRRRFVCIVYIFSQRDEIKWNQN